MRALARKEYQRAAEMLEARKGEEPYTAERLEADLAEYFEEHLEIRVDPVARSPKHCEVEADEHTWRVKQTLLDPNEYGEWQLDLDVDVERSRDEGRPVLRLGYLGP